MAEADICAPGTENTNGTDLEKKISGIKRPADANGDDVGGKKPNLSDNSSDASKVNQTKPANPAVSFNPNVSRTVIHKIPDKYVGLIIGKKGEQIVQIQNQHNCKVQIDQTSNGLPERSITIIGTTAQIEGVKKSMADLIAKAEMINNTSNGGDSRTSRVEIQIPGPKCGLVIGKNGETIKQLQEAHGIKMVILQDSNMPTLYDKTLVLTGDPSKIEKARDAVRQLIAMKEGESAPTGIITGEGRELKTYAVPVEVAGLVIGKRGETIKEIIRLSGAYVEIQRQPPPNPNIKIFNINGSSEQCDHAIKLICDRANLPPPSAQAMPYQGYGQNYGQWPSAYGNSSMPPPSINPATGQPDYTAAWAEYYRRQGMHDYANQLTSQSASGQMPSSNTSQQPYDYSQWQQYSQQWQQWQQQVAAWQQNQQYQNTSNSTS